MYIKGPFIVFYQYKYIIPVYSLAEEDKVNGEGGMLNFKSFQIGD